MTRPTLHYSPEYNLSLLGIEKLHPFDTGKSGKALSALRGRLGNDVVDSHIELVAEEVSSSDLLLTHSQKYLVSLSRSSEVAQILELPLLKLLPWSIVNRKFLRPVRLAVQGTIEAAQSALDTGLAVNLSGGFHHASHDFGGGFCAYSDIIISLRALQESLILSKTDSVLYIDLDAHQGNGVERLCQHFGMDEVFIFDMYCEGIYPSDEVAAERIDLAVPMSVGTGDELYLNTLKHRLPQAISMAQPVFAIYNAGTDILIGDPLGKLAVSAAGDRWAMPSYYIAIMQTVAGVSNYTLRYI